VIQRVGPLPWGALPQRSLNEPQESGADIEEDRPESLYLIAKIVIGELSFQDRLEFGE
jgi:hypothetical protein